jgi:hypothetical protein
LILEIAGQRALCEWAFAMAFAMAFVMGFASCFEDFSLFFGIFSDFTDFE